jgi:hypothetical protein
MTTVTAMRTANTRKAIASKTPNAESITNASLLQGSTMKQEAAAIRDYPYFGTSRVL